MEWIWKGTFSYSAWNGGRSWQLTLLFFPWEGKLFLAEKFLLDAKQYQRGGWDDAGKAATVFLLFLFNFFQLLCSTVLLKFPKWVLEVSQSCFCLRIAIQSLTFVWGWGGSVYLYRHFGLSHSALLIPVELEPLLSLFACRVEFHPPHLPVQMLAFVQILNQNKVGFNI